MTKINKWLLYLTTIICGFNSTFSLNAAQFIAPSEKQLNLLTFKKIQKSLEIRKVEIFESSTFTSITQNETEGFLGYHGNSLDFYIYQDIIRFIFEEILNFQIQKDFHFFAAPLDPILTIQSKKELTKIFASSKKPALALYDTTFPLNFSLWDNSNRLGLNSLEHYLKNESVKPLGYQKRLKWFFKKLGIPQDQILKLFTVAHKKLKSTHGVILQVFDTSAKPYAFSQELAYPAYSNGFIAENKTIDEYYTTDLPFPHEIRLLLTNHQTLNPNSPLKILRKVPEIHRAERKQYEIEMRNAIQKLPYNSSKTTKYLETLKKLWK